MISASMSLTEMRITFLRDMDTYVRKNCNRYSLEYWLTYGLPDGWDGTDLMEIAKDNELWIDCVNAFNNSVLITNS